MNNIDITLTFEEFKAITAFIQKKPWDKADPLMQMLNMAFMRSKKLLEEQNKAMLEKAKENQPKEETPKTGKNNK